MLVGRDDGIFFGFFSQAVFWCKVKTVPLPKRSEIRVSRDTSFLGFGDCFVGRAERVGSEGR